MKSFIVCDLGFGDSGKGTIVDALTQRKNATLNVRFSGGSNALHNVITDDGRHHGFSNFGSGSFHGADTLYTKDVLVNPHAIMGELEALHKFGLKPTLYINEDCLITTPLHVAANRYKAKLEGKTMTCGMGIGETMNLDLNEALSVNVNDGIWFKKNLGRIQDFYAEELPEAGIKNIDIDEIAEFYKFFFKYCVKIVSIDHSRHLMENEVVVFEGAQGILLDQDYGFNPYTTWSSTTTKNADQFLRDIDYQGEVTRIGVSRTYHTRHGDGPFPSERPRQFHEPHNGDEGFQGVFREGWFDAVMMRYAIDIQNKFNPLDGIAWTHTDLEHKSGIIRNYIFKGMRIDKLIPGKAETDILLNCKPSDEIESFWFSGEFGRGLITSSGPKTSQKTFYEI